MVSIIKGVLREELSNSRDMKDLYEKKLVSLPKGNLLKKKIGNHCYYYLQFRKNGKVIYEYKGKKLKLRTIEKYEKAKELRRKYRNNLAEVKREIKYIESILRGE